MAQTTTYAYGLGRRKSATARARLFSSGKGEITINNKPSASYFCDNEQMAEELLKPLQLIGKDKDFHITLLVSGGGLSGQVDACRLAISKALSTANSDLRTTLKKAGFLGRDPREKESKKYGLRKARKREQYSKR
ncbi:MAG TPA: 30S ribosomal protein S9 [Patescibacteria group bacterium]|jgi:small subunit ribosomal protein S9|nr:30S ribosomal protein S9 [Patescibacteria group bacterium]